MHRIQPSENERIDGIDRRHSGGRSIGPFAVRQFRFGNVGPDRLLPGPVPRAHFPLAIEVWGGLSVLRRGLRRRSIHATY